MRLAKIKNKYLFKSDKPDGIHTYAVYYDRKTKRNRAIQLTHLYVKDDKRFRQLKRGMIRVEKFKEFEVPSGVFNGYYSKDIKGNEIDLKKTNYIKLYNRYLSKAQSSRIKNFAVRDYNK